MSLYKFIKQIENDSTFIKLLHFGVIPLSVLNKKVYYDRYIQERMNNNYTTAILNVSEEYKVSTRTVERAVKFMKKN